MGESRDGEAGWKKPNWLDYEMHENEEEGYLGKENIRDSVNIDLMFIQHCMCHHCC